MSLASRVSSRFARRITQSSLPGNQFPAQDQLVQAFFRSKAPTLAGKVYDESPGLGTDRDRLPGRCVAPDGVDDVATTAPSASLAIRGDLTVAMWIKRTGTASNDYLFTHSTNGEAESTNVLYSISTSGSQLVYLHEYAGGNNEQHATGVNLVLGQLYHLVMVRDDTAKTVTIYLDAVHAGQIVYANSATGGEAGGLVIFGAAGTTSVCAQAEASDLQVFPQAITAEQALSFFQSPTTFLPGVQRAAWYKMDSQHPTLLLDSSGNANHATISGHNATVDNFFHEGAKVPVDYLNSRGYTDGGSGVAIPRDESNKAIDALGQPLQYRGKAPKPGQLTKSNCATFDGVDDFATAGTRLTNGALTSLSVFCRIKFTTTTNATVASEYYSSGNNRAWAVKLVSSGRLQVTISQDGTYGSASPVKAYTTDEGFNDGEWHEIGFVFAGGLLIIFADGLVLSVTITYDENITSIHNGSASFVVGAVNEGAADFLNGSICDVRIYERALTASEIQAYSSDNPEIDDANLVGWFPCAEGSGATLHNAMPGNPHLALSGINESTFWAGKQDRFAYNAAMGCTRYTHATLADSLVPFRADATPMPYTPPSGYAKDADQPAIVGHNLAESQIDFMAGIDYPTRNRALPNNLLGLSEDMTAWNGSTIVPTISSEISPLQRIAFHLANTSHNSQHRLSIDNQVVLTPGNYTFSVYAKQGELQYMGMTLYTGVYHYATFNLLNGNITKVTNCTATAYHVIAGWYLCRIIATITEDIRDANSASGLWPHAAGTTPSAPEAGDGVSGIHAAHAQLTRSDGQLPYTPGDHTLLDPLRDYHPVDNPGSQNPLFVRRITDNSQLIGGDRFVQYDQMLSGTRLAQAQKHTQTLEQ